MNLFAAIAIAATSFAAGYLFRRRPKKWICPGGYEDAKGFHCGARPGEEILVPRKSQDIPQSQSPSTPPASR
jgi:hypothetical protein